MLGERHRDVIACLTMSCDRYADPGLERCGPCTLAFMDGQARAETDQPLSADVYLAPLSEAQLAALRRIRDNMVDGRMPYSQASKHLGVDKQVIGLLARGGYLRVLENSDPLGRSREILITSHGVEA